MSDEMDDAEKIATLTGSMGAAIAVAIEALTQHTRYAGAEWLDELEQKSVLRMKNATVEGMSIEHDAAAIGASLHTIEFIFRVARSNASDDVES